MRNTTLCYIQSGGNYLLLHRTKKKNDQSHDKWLGIGGKFEDKESPEDCILREVLEETGLTLDENGRLQTENGQSSFAKSLKTLNGRTEIWGAAVEGIRDNPRILLIGTEKVGQTISPHWKMEVQHSHSSWMEALYQLGIPGLLAALALTGLAVWNGAVLLWRNTDLLHSCVVMVVLCLMGCAVMEPYLFVANAQFHYFDFLFLLCLGYMDQWRRQTRNRKGERIDV